MVERLDSDVIIHIEKGNGPRVRQSPNCARNIKDLRSQHLFAYNFHQLSSVHSVVVRPNFHVSRTPLKDLKQISLRELSVDCTFLGGYLILRTIEPALGKDAITTIVEDHEGNCAIFKLFNFTINWNSFNINQIMHIGTVFVLKEPFCGASFEGDCIVNCESLSDMIIVYEGHELSRLTDGISWKIPIIDPTWKNSILTNANAWKIQATDWLFLKNYQLSTRCYYQALKNIDYVTNKAALQNILNYNIGLVYFERGFHEKSLKFIDKFLEVEPEDPKALSSAGKSCYQLGKYDDAIRYFKRDKTFSVNTNSMIQKCYDRIGEKTKGKFDMKDIFNAHCKDPQGLLEFAEYNGPIKIAQIEGKGRGVVVTSDTTPGTLLVVSKALAYSCKKMQRYSQSEEFEYWQDLLVQLAHKIACNPKTFGPIIYSLYDGRSPSAVDPRTIFCDPEVGEEPIVDMAKLKSIIDVNTIINEKSECEVVHGVFEWPSHFNHCCLPNTSVQIFNDLLIIRAIQSIKEGEEACIPCLTSHTLLHQRAKVCTSRGVQCTCRFCMKDREITMVERNERGQLVQIYESLFVRVQKRRESSVPQIIREISFLIRSCEKHEMDPYIRKTVLASLYTLFAMAVAVTTYRKKLTEKIIAECEREIECHKMVLKLSGFNPPDMLRAIEEGEELIPPNAHLNKNVLLSVVRLISNYDQLANRKYSMNWWRILNVLETCYSGGGIGVLKLL